MCGANDNEVCFLSTVLFYRGPSTHVKGHRRKSTSSKHISSEPVQRRRSSRLSQLPQVTMAESGDEGYASDAGYDTEESYSGDSEQEEEPKVTLQLMVVIGREIVSFPRIVNSNLLSMM